MAIEFQHHLDRIANEWFVIDDKDMSLRKSWRCHCPN